jgi:exopolyphosphatase/guanosine-5'-triphosphate,3'-diphosphate pyrophosphatase
MLFGAIDVGTNSIHLIVVDVDERYGTTRVLYKAREMVRLGAGDLFERGRLGHAALSRGVDAMERFAAAARSRGVENLRAVATSAVREAENGQEFVDAVRERSGIDVQVLTDIEEARLIALGVAHGYPIYDRLACIVDIGGGSTEFIVADGRRTYLLESVKLGSLRMYDAYLRDAPRSGYAYAKMEERIAQTLAPVVDRLRNHTFDLVIGTSGTIMGLAALDAGERGIQQPRIHGYRLDRERLRTLQMRMRALDESERKRMPGMNPRRADIIVAGNAILIAALDMLDARALVVCERALREGLVVETVAQRGSGAVAVADDRARRRDTVEALAQKYGSAGVHERTVARLALSLFTELAEVHKLPVDDGELLYAAAVLHDIGHFVAKSGHHKHGAYIIRGTPLEGWRDEERESIAAVVRYHRKSMPKPSHADFAALGTRERYRVSALAALLRIAEGLDSRHLGVVMNVAVEKKAGMVLIRAQADEPVTGELAVATMRADLFERTFGMSATFLSSTARDDA